VGESALSKDVVLILKGYSVSAAHDGFRLYLLTGIKKTLKNGYQRPIALIYEGGTGTFRAIRSLRLRFLCRSLKINLNFDEHFSS